MPQLSDIHVFDTSGYFILAKNSKGEILGRIKNDEQYGHIIYPEINSYYTAATLKHLLEKVEELNNAANSES